MNIQEMLEFSKKLPKKEIVISDAGGDEGGFAILVPESVFTDPALISAVKAKDFNQADEILKGLGRMYFEAHPEKAWIDDINDFGSVVGKRRLTEDEVDEYYLTCPTSFLKVVEVQGKYKIEGEYDDDREYVTDQVDMLTEIVEMEHGG